MARDLAGSASAWRKVDGKPLAIYGRLAGLIGEHVEADPVQAVQAWREFVAWAKATKRGDGKREWAGVTLATVRERFPRWLQDRATTAPADSSLTVVASMLADRCGIDLRLVSANERGAFEAIAEDGARYGLTAAHLAAAIADARREPRFATGGIPAWRLRLALASVMAAIR